MLGGTRCDMRRTEAQHEDVQHEQKADHQARNDPGNEQTADGGFGQRAENQKGQAGRYQQPQGATAGQASDHRFLVVTAPDHFRVRDRPDRGSRRQAGPADRAEQRANGNVRVQQPAGNFGEDRRECGIGAFGYTAAQQNFAQQNEHGNGAEGKRIKDAPDRIDGQIGRAVGIKMQDDQARQTKGRAQGDARTGGCHQQSY